MAEILRYDQEDLKLIAIFQLGLAAESRFHLEGVTRNEVTAAGETKL